MGLKSLLFAAPAALLAAPAWAGEELLFGPIPEWVEPHGLEPVDGPGTAQPVRSRLIDNQVRMENGKRTVYTAYALQLQTPEGLSAGNLSIPWRPETDDLTIHRVAIHRGGEIIDVLESGQTFTALRREQNLEQATLDGVLTANMFPADLQVGDTLEVAVSLVSENPVFGQHDEVILGPFNAPVDRAFARLLWPEGEDVHLARTAGMPGWKRSRQHGFEIAEIELANVETVPPPAGAPSRFGFLGFVEASDFASWADLAAHFAPLYARAGTVPAEGTLRTEVERIRAASSDPAARAEAALKLVQSRVRYVAVLLGEGGLKPTDAATTWSRRFGDCKAKTALLLAILGELGIEAEPVFVSSAFGDALPERLPMIAMFDHVLVRARMDGRDYWLDGTRTGDGSLAALEVPAYDWGLPVRPGAELVRMLPPPLETPREEIDIVMNASGGLRAPVPTTIELILRGDAAVGANLALANLVGEARDRALREYWRERFDFIAPDEVGLAFDGAARELRLTMEGRATLDWDGQWYETEETGVGYQADFTREPGPGRDAPYAVGYPFFERTRQTIHLPPGAGFTNGGIDDGADVDETVAGIEYRRRATLSGNTFVVERTARSVAAEFPAADASRFERRLRDLRDSRVFLRLPNSYRPTEADLAATLSVTPDDAADLLAQGNELANAGRFEEALARFSRAVELAPNDSYAWANRGIALVNQGAFDAAVPDLDQAHALDPRNAVVFRARGLLAERKGEFDAAIGHFTTAIDIDPGSGFAWGHRAKAHWRRQDAESALADSAEATRLAPDYFEMYSIRAAILHSKGKPDEAEAEVERMLAANADEPAAFAAAAHIYRVIGLREKARQIADRSISQTGTPAAFLARAQTRDPSDAAGRLADLDEALRLDPAFAPALMERANLHWSASRLDQAVADTDALLALPGVPGPEVNLLRANLFDRLGRPEAAIAEAAAVLANHPDMPWAHAAAGKIYSRFGMRKEAFAALDRAIELAPDGGFYLDRSQVRERDDRAGRLADMEEQLRRVPDDLAALFGKAALLAEMDDHVGAAAVYSRILEVGARTFDVSARVNALGERGVALWSAGRHDEAEADFVMARELADDAIALNNLCWSKAVAAVALERALAECEESLRLRPDFAPALDSRGAVLLRLGRFDEAVRDFDRVLELQPGYTNSRYLRAVARARQGDRAGSEADLGIVRANSPNLVERMEGRGFVVEIDETARVE